MQIIRSAPVNIFEVIFENRHDTRRTQVLVKARNEIAEDNRGREAAVAPPFQSRAKSTVKHGLGEKNSRGADVLHAGPEAPCDQAIDGIPLVAAVDYRPEYIDWTAE